MSAVHPTIFVIGGAVADLSLCGVDSRIFYEHSTPLDRMPISPGGDGMNEALVLAQLGECPALCTLLGKDAIGSWLKTCCEAAGADTRFLVTDADVATSLNVVLVTPDGQRTFVTAKNTSLRLLAPEHAAPAVEAMKPGDIVCFASIFVSPCFGLGEMETLFRTIHEKGCILCADMTRAKNGEKVNDLRGLLRYVDYLFPNEKEGAMLTDTESPEDTAQAFLECGASHVVLKLGEKGCLLADENGIRYAPAYPDCHVVDTTGAGDTFAAAFLSQLARGAELSDCLRFANAAASICVEQVGCGSEAITMEKVLKRMKQLPKV